MFRKNRLAMLVGEFLGTGALTFAVLSAIAVLGHAELSVPGGTLPLTLPVAFFMGSTAGLVLVLMTLALGGISGAAFNPAITLALWTVRKIRTLQALSYIAVQILGGLAAYGLYVYFTKQHLTNNGHYDARVMVAEALGTFIFAFGSAAAIYQRFNLAVKAVAVGGSMMLGVIVASIGSRGFLNPSIALGSMNWGWGTYVLGPILGAVIGFNLYNLLFVETELAEVAELKEEQAEVSKQVAAANQAQVVTDAKTSAEATVAKAKISAAKTKTAATQKKMTVKKTSTARRSK